MKKYIVKTEFSNLFKKYRLRSEARGFQNEEFMKFLYVFVKTISDLQNLSSPSYPFKKMLEMFKSNKASAENSIFQYFFEKYMPHTDVLERQKRKLLKSHLNKAEHLLLKNLLLINKIYRYDEATLKNFFPNTFSQEIASIDKDSCKTFLQSIIGLHKLNVVERINNNELENEIQKPLPTILETPSTPQYSFLLVSKDSKNNDILSNRADIFKNSKKSVGENAKKSPHKHLSWK